MTDMMRAIEPKSDQLNADDLIVGPRTIRIRDVQIKASPEQPVSIFFEGDDGKPWKPCKSMSRLLVALWGADAKNYKGKSLTLFRDPSVKWGGMDVGGIRISHMSDIRSEMTFALTTTRNQRKPYTVKKLEPAPAPDRPAATTTTTKLEPERLAKLSKGYDLCSTREDLEKLEKERGELWALMTADEKSSVKGAVNAARARLGLDDK